jgi:hypothetical protein
MKRLIIVWAVVLTIISWTSTVHAQAVPEGLIGYWRFDEKDGDTAMDSSGNGHHGTLIDKPKWVDGNWNGALEFDGATSYVNMDGFKGPMQGPWTITCWIKTETGGAMDIVSWGTEGGGLKVEFRLDAGRLRVEHGNGNNRGDALANDGQWHHAVAQLPDGATTIKEVLFFLDGEQLGVFQIGNGDNPFQIAEDKDFNVGRSGPRGDRYFNGLIDDVKLYSRALTKDEIMQAMDPEAESVEAKGKLATRWGMLKAR